MPTINGTSGDDNLSGTSGDDVIYGFAGNDMLSGELGVDQTVGGLGDDRHIVDNASDVVVELAGEGNDTLITSVNYTLAAGVSIEILEMFDFAGAINLTGNELSNRIYGNWADNIIVGGPAGGLPDWMSGSAGNDTYYVNNSADIVDDNLGDNIIYTSVSYSLTPAPPTDFPPSIVLLAASDPTSVEVINLTGNESNQEVRGNAGNNILMGVGGNDILAGGAGNDTLDGGDGQDRASYWSAAAAVTVSLAIAGAQNTLGDGIDTLTSIEDLEGSAHDDTLTGNSGANTLYGLAGNDTLNGGAGADQMFGGAGDDIFYVDNAGDVVSEDASEGADEVRTALAYTLGADLENLRLTGLAGVAGTGNGLDNIIRGNDAANTLSGLGGADSLYGNGGNDALNGDDGDDWLMGDAGNDILIGDAGYDRMYGGIGDDIYYAIDATDFAYENAGEGHDTMIASLDHQLRAEVEDLLLIGSAVIGKGNAGDNGITGNDFANRLYGYGGNDLLDGQGGDDYLAGAEGDDTLIGGAGYDRMYGGVGDDTYIVNDTTDYAYELAGEGTDRVIASINHQLRVNIENLELTGSADLRGYGNELGNQLIGNSGANLLYGRDGNDHVDGNAGNDILYGENGNDWLEGGAGMDRFYGGTGADDFAFRNGDFAGLTSGTADRIHDFSAADGDQIRLDGVDANSGLAGDQGFAFIGSGAFSHTAGELRYAQISGNTYVQGDIDGDGQADFWIRLDGLHALAVGDFVL